MGVGTKRQHSSEDSADEIDKLPSVPRRSMPAPGDTTDSHARRAFLRRGYLREISERSDGRLTRKSTAPVRSRRRNPQSPQQRTQAPRRSERAARRKPCPDIVHSDDDENDDDDDNDHPERGDEPTSPPYSSHSLRNILPSSSRRQHLNSRRKQHSPYTENTQRSDRMSDSQSPDSPKKRPSSRLQASAPSRLSARISQRKKDSKLASDVTKDKDDGDSDDDEIFNDVDDEHEADDGDANDDGDDDNGDSDDVDDDDEEDDTTKNGSRFQKQSRRSTRTTPVRVTKFKQTKIVKTKSVSKSKDRKLPSGNVLEEREGVKTRKYRRLTRGSALNDIESTADRDAHSIESKQRSTSNGGEDSGENDLSRKKGHGSDGDEHDDDGDGNDEEEANDDGSNDDAAAVSERSSDDDRDDGGDDDDRLSDSERSDASGEEFDQSSKQQLPRGIKESSGSKAPISKAHGSTLSEQVSDEDVESWQNESSKKSGERLTSRQRAMQGESVELEYTKLESPKLKKKQSNEDFDQDEEIELKKQQKARLRQMISEKRNKEKRAAMVDRVLRGVTSKRKKTTMATEAHVAEVGTRLTTNEAREGCLRFTSNREGTTISLPTDASAPFHLLASVKAHYPRACTRDPKTGKRIFTNAL